MNIEREDNLAAALAHAAVIFSLPGLAVPLGIYALDKSASPRLRFQVAQALTFQVIGNTVYVGISVVISSLSFLSFIPLAALSSGDFNANGPDSLGAIILMLVFMILMFLVLLVWATITTFGLWAAWRCLKGQDYRYPLIGSLAERLLLKRAQPAPETAQ